MSAGSQLLLMDESKPQTPKLRHQPPARRFGIDHDLHRRRTTVIAVFATLAILLHLVLRFVLRMPPEMQRSASSHAGFRRYSPCLRTNEKSSAARIRLRSPRRISIVTSVLLREYLAGSIVVPMLSGGEALENYALRNASSVLRALAKRMPAIAHRKRDCVIADVALDDIAVGDTLVVYPHDICPVDGTVIEGNGVMNEAFLTGEPFGSRRRKARP